MIVHVVIGAYKYICQTWRQKELSNLKSHRSVAV